MTASPLARLVEVAEELGLECDLGHNSFDCHAPHGTFYLLVRRDGAMPWHAMPDDDHTPIHHGVCSTLAEAEDALRRWARGDDA